MRDETDAVTEVAIPAPVALELLAAVALVVDAARRWWR
jgi:hypothetical protein